MKITDEMIENAEFAFADAWAQRTGAIRAALNAVAPLIRAEALEEAARVADEHLGSRQDGIAAVIRALKDTPPKTEPAT